MLYKKGGSDTERRMPHEQDVHSIIVIQKLPTLRLYLHKSGPMEEARGFGTLERDDAG